MRSPTTSVLRPLLAVALLLMTALAAVTIDDATQDARKVAFLAAIAGALAMYCADRAFRWWQVVAVAALGFALGTVSI